MGEWRVGIGYPIAAAAVEGVAEYNENNENNSGDDDGGEKRTIEDEDGLAGEREREYPCGYHGYWYNSTTSTDAALAAPTGTQKLPPHIHIRIRIHSFPSAAAAIIIFSRSIGFVGRDRPLTGLGRRRVESESESWQLARGARVPPTEVLAVGGVWTCCVVIVAAADDDHGARCAPSAHGYGGRIQSASCEFFLPFTILFLVSSGLAFNFADKNVLDVFRLPCYLSLPLPCSVSLF